MSVLDYPIKINGVVFENTLDNDVHIDKTNLDAEFEKYSAKYCYYGTLAEMAAGQEDRLKVAVDTLYAHLDAKKREEGQASMAVNPKFKYTEAMYENLVKTDKNYQALQREYIDAKQLAGSLIVATRSMQGKIESLKHFSRIEMGSSADTRVYNEQIRNAITKR